MDLKIIDRLISKCTSWDQLYNELSTNKKLTKKFKGDVFERLTQSYLLTMPEYSSKLSDVWLSHDIPQKVLKKLNMPSRDFGIDLVAKTNRGEYWTVQCKFKSTSDALTYKKLSTFASLSFITAKNISLGLISHSSAKPIRNRKFMGNVAEIGLGRWASLSADEWNNITNFCKHKTPKLLKRKPRPHQNRAIELSKKYYSDKKKTRGKLIMPCATGKSLTAFWIALSLESKKTIVAVPSLSLIKQSLNDWTKEYLANGIEPEWLCVCSDKTVGKIEADEFDSDIYDIGIPTTTNIDEIVSFLKQRNKKPKIIFTTYQSSARLADASIKANCTYELAIFDEAHKTVGMKEKSFATLLFNKNIKIKKRLFMTATERMLRGKHDEIVSMNDSKIYGDTIFNMSFKNAIQDNIISDYKILTMTVSDSDVNQLIEDKRYILQENIDKETNAQYLASGIALKKTFKKYKTKHAVSFHRSIKQAKLFKEQQNYLNQIQSLGPNIENFHISSKKSSGERVVLIKEFTEAKNSLITNARCLTEGVDVPSIDCVMFVDPKQSVIDIVQAAGRALRKYNGKNYGYILLPIIVPEKMELEEFSETTPFKKIISIIAALSSQDERIAEELSLKNNENRPLGKIIEINSNINLSKKINTKNFASFINTKIWEKVAKVNYRDFIEAKTYIQDLKLKNTNEWQELLKSGNLPSDIPKHPERIYINQGWVSFGDWLGNSNLSNRKRNFLDFKNARNFARSLNLKNTDEWRAFTKTSNLPDNIPVAPNSTYKNKGWKSMQNWLGTKELSYLPYSKAANVIKKLKLKNQKEWRAFTKTSNLPDNIPASPSKVYKDKGWKSFGEWLGTGFIATKDREFKPYKMAQIEVHKLKLQNTNAWRAYIKNNELPVGVPRVPHKAYKNKGWKGYKDWLGNN